MQFTRNGSCSQNLSIKSAPKQAQMNANTFASGPSTTNTYLLMPPTLGITAISEHDGCCGAKDAVGRSDVKVPGRRTTFIIHCQRIGNENTFKFEILNKKNNNPWGYYFYADLDWAQYGIWAEEYTDDPDSVYFEFVLHRWCGPVIAIRTYRPGPDPSNWVTFEERRNSDGRVTAFRNLVSDKKNSLPNFADT